MTTFARIENGTAVEVGVQDYPPIGSDGAPAASWVKVLDEVSVGWTTPDGGKTWVAPTLPPTPTAPTLPAVTSTQFDQAVQTLTAALDPAVPAPTVAEQVQALAVIVASGPLPAPPA